jgi:hypothetical protein
LVEQFEGVRPYSLDLFLEYTGLTELEFFEIAISHKVEGHTAPVSVRIGPKPPDLESWTKHPKLSVEEKESAISKWRGGTKF